MKSLITSLLLVLLATVAASLGGNGVGTAARNAVGGRSNFRRLEPTDGDDYYYNQDEGEGEDEFGSEEVVETTTAATLVTTTASENNEDIEEVVATPPSLLDNDNEVEPTGFGGDETTDIPSTPAANNDGSKCTFCEGGMPDPDLVVEEAGGKNCAEVKEAANGQVAGMPGNDICKTVIQPLQSACCPQIMPSDGVPPAFAEGAGDDAEEVTTTTTTTPAAEVGEDEGNDFEAGEGNDPDAEVTTTTSPESVGGDANDFVGDQDNAEDTTTTTTTAATPSVETTESGATEAALSMEACVQSAEYAGKEDPLYACCATHPEAAICILNGCMDFESQVITCQCKEVKGIGKGIFTSHDPMGAYLPEDFESFLGTFHKCCPSNDVSPKEFNDCYYDEVSEEIMEEIEEEYEEEFEQPTYKPTPRPISVYIPLSDDEDPVAKEGTEDFSNGQKDDSLQGMVNAYLDGVESPDEMKSDKNIQVVAVSLVVVFLVLMLVTAHLVMDYPDGLCASFCRLILKCLCCLIRVLCLPCRAICCKGSDQTRSRRTHAPMRAPFPSDLELA